MHNTEDMEELPRSTDEGAANAVCWDGWQPMGDGLVVLGYTVQVETSEG